MIMAPGDIVAFVITLAQHRCLGGDGGIKKPPALQSQVHSTRSQGQAMVLGGDQE